MKLAIVISSLTGGGAERVAINLCEYIDKMYKGKVSCDLIVLNMTGDHEANCHVIYINKHYSNGNILNKLLYHKYLYVKKLKKLKKTNHYDKVISLTPLPNIVNIKSKSNEKCVISVRNYTSFNLSKREKALTSKYYNKADEVVAVSELCKEDLLENFSINKEKIKVIYNPYQIKKINIDKLEPLDKKWDNLFNDHTLISVGRISKQKAFWRLLKAVSIVKTKFPDVKLAIIGKELDTTEHTEILNRIIKKFNIEENILFVGFDKNPYKYMNKSAVYVLSSLFEGFPNAMTEAMAVGLPIVSVNCLSGPKEILAPKVKKYSDIKEIYEGEFGIIIPQYDEGEDYYEICDGDRELAKAIVSVLSDNKKSKNYSMKAMERVKDFSVDKIVKQWLI